MTTTKAELLADLALIEQAYGATPQLPQGFELIGMITVDPAITARLLAMEDSVHLPLFKALFTPDQAPWGFVAIDPAGTVHICIRGTETKLEWAEDANAVLVSMDGKLWVGAKVHEGFQMVFGAISGSLGKLIAISVPRARSYRLQGHSLGSPLAAQLRVLLRSSRVAVRLWAPPRLGNGDYCNAWNARTPDAISIINPFDLVPKLPPPGLGYGNLGTQLRLQGCGGGWFDLGTAHSLELGYAPGVAAMAG
jgi:hypothetical protein